MSSWTEETDAMPGDTPLTALDYELFMLHAMVDAPPDLVEEALAVVGANRSTMEASYQRVQAENFILRPSFAPISEILGPPLHEEQRHEAGQRFTVRTFALRLWPAFALEVYGRSDGMVWDERFVRTAANTPLPADPSQLKPWTATKPEIESRFGPLEEIELWAPHASYSLTHQPPVAAPTRYDLVFSRSLLQRTEPHTSSG
ncbi:hypothetical protein [Actinomadura kijaniata]|uniref:hypothetical protein n=1 Tax=Actinomadura kijaniata TaxID=46161 RepID=UPI0012FA66B7|nr:hypothetical protein [Actinomadura kijaniata]